MPAASNVVTPITSRSHSLADAPRRSIFRPFPVPQTARQWFYLAVLQGVGAGIIDGGANFSIAYAMYGKQSVVKMWVFKDNTIAGDLGVTPIIQCLASMLITSTLVHTDLHHHAIQPLPFVYPHVEHLPDPRTLSRSRSSVASDMEKGEAQVPRRGIAYYYWMLVRFIFEGTEKNMMLARVGVANWFGRLLWTAAQGAAIGVIFGFPIWCLAIVILGPIYGNTNMGGKWAPQVIKLVYGAIVGWVTNPVIATLALGSQAEHHLVLVEEASAENVDVAEGVSIIQEEDEEDMLAPPIHTFGTSDAPSPRPSTRRPSTLRLQATPARPRGNTATSRSSLPSPTTSLRPPLTADASNLSVTLGTPVSVRPTRARGATVSTAISATSFSYALGGTGGRARRPHAGTSVSARSVLQTGAESLTAPPAQATFGRAPLPGGRLFADGHAPPVTATSQMTELAASGGERASVWDVFGRIDEAPTGRASREGGRLRRSTDGALMGRPNADHAHAAENEKP